MEEFIVFLRENWTYIAPLLLLLVDVILFIIKKRSKTEIIDPGIYKELVDLIIRAENRFGEGRGNEKLAYVLSNFQFSNHPELDRDAVVNIIEYILVLPTKKGGYGREEDQ